MYILLKKLSQPGYKIPYYTVLESNDLNAIVEKFKNQVVAGCPVDDLRIVKNQPFEFKCGIKFIEEET